MLLPQASPDSSVSFRTATKPLELFPPASGAEPGTKFNHYKFLRPAVTHTKLVVLETNTTDWGRIPQEPEANACSDVGPLCVTTFYEFSPRQKPKPANDLLLTVALCRLRVSGAKSPQRQSGSARRSNSKYQTDYCHGCTYINSICSTVYRGKIQIYGCSVHFFMYRLNSKITFVFMF